MLRLGTLNEALQCIKIDVESVEISVQKLSMVMKSLCIDYKYFVSCFGLGFFQCLQRKNFGADSPLVQENFRWVCCDNLLLGTHTHRHCPFTILCTYRISKEHLHFDTSCSTYMLANTLCVYVYVYIYIHTCCPNCFQPFPVGPSNICIYIYIRAVCCMHCTFSYAHIHMHIHITHHTSRIITLHITHTHSRAHAHMHTCTHSHTHTRR